MAQVFLSYDREDAVKARAIAQALERAGHFVWWDLHIKGGAEYGREIEKALENSDAVVVLWSEKSIDSAWVRDEAAAGRDSGRLIPVLIDQASPPMGFRQYQNLNFSSWSGRGKPPGMTELLASIQALGDPSDAGARPVRTTAPQPTTRPTVSRPLKWSLIGGAVVLALTALGIVLQSDRGNRDVHTVAVAAADAAAGPLARDLLVNLGRLQSAKSGSARLVSAAGHAGNEVDLIFEIASANDGTTGADLVLMAGKDRSVLWSKDFRQESAELADLKQQLAFSAARALGCGLEGLGHDSGSLDQQILKLYLNACADLDEQFSTNAHALVPSLSRVTAKAPSFAPAWSKLLLVQAEAIEANRGPEPDPAAVRALRR